VNWKTVEDYTPPANTDLLVTVAGKKHVWIARYITPYTLEASDDYINSEEADLCDITDTHFCKEGWYSKEPCEMCGVGYVRTDITPTHWQVMPEGISPKGLYYE
jgi:hypothetical protein